MLRAVHRWVLGKCEWPAWWVFNRIALRAKAHVEPANSFNIRVVQLVYDRDDETLVDSIIDALDLLDKHYPEKLARVRKHLEQIIFFRYSTNRSDGSYNRLFRFCVLNGNTIKQSWSPVQRAILWAGLLTHESTHGYLLHIQKGCSNQPQDRVERICSEIQDRVVVGLVELMNVSDELAED